ncbi:hypothetical protein IVG45_21805 [Methylomonas sp. LL1]|nr:hypothetical protein [Methylomonas sp. LL1]QPK63400.1 hypothetical protein IVG45_21805 [Methylomonas sp. LL1]
MSIDTQPEAKGGLLSMVDPYSTSMLEDVPHYFPKTRLWMEEKHEY